MSHPLHSGQFGDTPQRKDRSTNMHDCPRCDGEGTDYTPDDHPFTCMHCGGTGKMYGHERQGYIEGENKAMKSLRKQGWQISPSHWGAKR